MNSVLSIILGQYFHYKIIIYSLVDFSSTFIISLFETSKYLVHLESIPVKYTD